MKTSPNTPRKVKKPIWRKTGIRRAVNKKVKVISISSLTKLLDTKMSLYVRLKGSDKEGICTCYTCGHRAHYKKMQNGHFVSRFYKSTRWEESNTRIQCPMCNIWKRGDLLTFRENLIKEIGEIAVLQLETARKHLFRPSREYLLSTIGDYEAKLKELSPEV